MGLLYSESKVMKIDNGSVLVEFDSSFRLHGVCCNTDKPVFVFYRM